LQFLWQDTVTSFYCKQFYIFKQHSVFNSLLSKFYLLQLLVAPQRLTWGFVQGWQDVVLPKQQYCYWAFVQGWTYIVGLLVVTFYFFIFSRQRFRGWTLKRPALHKALPVSGN
jgi:hypothetical protein